MNKQITPHVWCDGAPAESALAQNRALHYGDGVFRTCLLAGGVIDALDAQLAHLQADAARLQLMLADHELLALRAELQAAVQAAGRAEGVVKILLARQASGRGYAPGSGRALRLIFIDSAPPPPRAGFSACRSAVVLGEQPLLAGIKHLNRLEQVLAVQQAPAGADEVLLCDRAGQLIGGARSNVLCLDGARLLTPALDRCGVAGLTRARALAAAQALGLEVRVDALPYHQLTAARSIAVCNSLMGIQPLTRLDGRDLPPPAPELLALMGALGHPRMDASLAAAAQHQHKQDAATQPLKG